MNKSALIIFIKNPVKGQVKTRLARDVGDEKALEVYQQLLKHTSEIARQIPAERYLFYSEHIVNDHWDNDHFHKRIQSGGDLGSRMSDAFSFVLQKHEKAVIIGSDCPELDASIIDEAFMTLDKQDCVIGPTYDGGYYLLGLKKMIPELFRDIPWSTDLVYKQTINKLENRNTAYKSLRMLRDIDTLEDYKIVFGDI